MRANIGLAVGVFCCALALSVLGDEGDYPIQPHPETQDLFARWLATANRAQAEDHYALLARLEPLARDDYQRFVEQVMYFVHHLSQQEKARASVVRSLVQYCMVPKGRVATALSPHLYGEHPALRKEAWGLFHYSIGSGFPQGYADLSYIRDHVTGNRQKEEIATPLKRAIFEVAPNAAFRLFLPEAERLEGLKLARAEHTLENALFERNINIHERGYLAYAKERGQPDGDLPLPPPWKLDATTIAAMRELASSKHWWARMVVAEFMVRNKDLRVAELIEKLKKEENDLVRQSATSIETPDPLRSPSFGTAP